jgi:predicted PurR-regulated permease PerM
MHTRHIPRAIGAALLLLLIVGGVGSMAFRCMTKAASMIQTLPEAAQKIRQSLRKEWGSPKGSGT